MVVANNELLKRILVMILAGEEGQCLYPPIKVLPRHLNLCNLSNIINYRGGRLCIRQEINVDVPIVVRWYFLVTAGNAKTATNPSQTLN